MDRNERAIVPSVRVLGVFVALGLILLPSVAGIAQTPSLQQRMLAAEDARAPTATDMAPLFTGLRSTDPRIVVQAVRALGRLERPELVKQILPLTTHAKADVRAEALNALGQSLARLPQAADVKGPFPPEVETVTETLVARLRADADPYVTGVAAETLGRLPYRTAEAVLEAHRTLASMLPPAEGETLVRSRSEPLARVVHPGAVTGAVKGLETLARVYQKLAPPDARTVGRLRGAATLGSDPSDADFAYIRRVAWLALNAATGADASLVERGLEDPDAQVRRLAVLTLAEMKADDEQRSTLLRIALRDQSFIVRYDAVRVYSRTLQRENCAPILAAVDDTNPHVALAAIDALGAGCPGAAEKLAALADELPNPEPRTRNPEPERGTRNPEPGTRNPEPRTENPEPGTLLNWLKPAHAFVSLSRIARDDAAARLARFAEHPVWQVRMYAARGAEALAAVARLERLAADPHDNVREAALQALAKLRHHAADPIFIDALARPDYQLVMTAAKLLDGSPDAERAAPALLAAFRRITAEHRDTSRDVRLALLERLRELGTAQQAPTLHSCLGDFDHDVAESCAAVLRAWTGSAPATTAAKHAVVPVTTPTPRRLRVTMRRVGSFDLRLFSDEAPATIARLVALARKGYYNGLTFHRVVPNFVLQGGSPGANEYMGDGPFMRDELGLRTHRRGTLGISTRGRDTGDAQIFINLLDNPRLDHNYTVFAEVSAGMDVVDTILEGDVIDRVDVLEQAATQSRP